MATALHFAHKEPPTQSVDEMSIHESLQKLSGSYVKVTAKIVHIEQETQNITTRAGKQLVLRNATLADETNQCRLSLWASHIDAVTLNTSYNFTNLVVKDFDETKFLSTSPTSTFQQTDDLENVNFELIEHKFDGEPSMVAITSHYACRNCNMKLDIEVNMPTLPPTHKCHSCSFRQRMNASAKQTFLKIKFENNPTYTVNSAVTHKFISENPETQNMSDDLEEFLFTKTVTVILNNKDNTAVKELKLA
ncbi:uncharacterized protein LOC117341365 [Pecten maximus]|uniref:uncharacterized protein LOC117341365 n=1 Tax=Pecten maximus TaxID=6579 RepID=UPI0014580A78|nr:uncharacterized protein LOC117341365 [Pecten maximus]